MQNQKPDECGCEKTSCGCAGATAQPCSCGAQCACASACGCSIDCGCE